jgi:predicted nuclease of predicted toxin-antitoxin system
LLVDEDSQAHRLVKLLRKTGHDVLTVNEAGLSGSSDWEILDCARREGRLLLTKNCRDFEVLHLADSNHPGILAVYQDANTLKNMKLREIVKAIANLEAANIPLANQFIALNHWNY